MRKHNAAKNIISIMLGAAIAAPICVCASESQQARPALIHEDKSGSVNLFEAGAQKFEQHEDIEGEDRQAELQLLAVTVMAEAGNQDMIGKRLVVDVILNRVDSDEYPDTITGVIYDANQFTVVSDGSLERAYKTVTQECFDAVAAELDDRLDYDIEFFTAGDFGQYGEPAYQWDDHYFSK